MRVKLSAGHCSAARTWYPLCCLVLISRCCAHSIWISSIVQCCILTLTLFTMLTLLTYATCSSAWHVYAVVVAIIFISFIFVRFPIYFILYVTNLRKREKELKRTLSLRHTWIGNEPNKAFTSCTILPGVFGECTSALWLSACTFLAFRIQIGLSKVFETADLFSFYW